MLCQQPVGKQHVMYQSWQKLLFLHWVVDAAEIQKKLPQDLFVDTFDGHAYLGLVPFYMWNIRPRFLPALPGVSYFLELNVRTYVHDAKGVPGVWFFSLDTNKTLAAYLGRRFFNMPYTTAEMQASRSNEGEIHYQCLRTGRSNEEKADYIYRGTGAVTLADPGTLEYFLVERYLLYAVDSQKGNLYSGRVFHPSYPLQQAEVSSFSLNPIKQAGFEDVSGEPVHAHYSEGVDVLAYAIERQDGNHNSG
ncbi:MAG: DUF2071 domain-containing protein [Verrucomicrobiota bacterium]